MKDFEGMKDFKGLKDFQLKIQNCHNFIKKLDPDF
jgi:hypothetical protein